MQKLFDMANDVFDNNLNVILIQIDEAHSSAWPMYIENQPEPQQTFENRIERANHFVYKYQPPYEVYIDGWNNDFAELFRAWPDKYHCINKDFKIIAKADYHTDGEKEATVIEDYSNLLAQILLKQSEQAHKASKLAK